MITASTMCLGAAGMASLCLAMERHHERVWSNTRLAARHAWALRTAGWLLLIVAAVLAVLRQGASMGLTLWVMEISLAAVCVGLLLSYAPRLLPLTAASALLVAWV